MPHPRHRTTAARRLLVGTALAVAALALAACGDDGGAAVSVSGAWARATVAGQSNGAAYLTLRGTGTADALVGVHVDGDVAARTELHRTVTAGGSGSSTSMGGTGGMGGTMSMEPVARVSVPAHGTVELQPGGYHIMLLDLAKPLDAGSHFKLRLDFQVGPPQTVSVEVRS
jgi:copper(I)-binding protein